MIQSIMKLDLQLLEAIMSKIRVMSENLANKIADWELVEKFASVVK